MDNNPYREIKVLNIAFEYENAAWKLSQSFKVLAITVWSCRISAACS